ncbi:MAG: hypothetical protein EZS28_051353 [Streblomastix strix]|uniref:Uncharacterized protein n=1 Tax=Streblomastix strix TaxID=222440 RepID=A0A5J4T6H3_9EUKA|nr:MAG: hypothetical protein EZS28_051353 [Streblomastix strix]
MILSDIEEQEQQVQNLMLRIIRGPVRIEDDERGRNEVCPRIIVVTSQQTPDDISYKFKHLKRQKYLNYFKIDPRIN